MSIDLRPDLEGLAGVARELEHAAPADIIRWAHDRYGAGLVVTASFGDATLVHLAATSVPGIEVVLLDTGYLFAETHWYAERLRARFDVNLRIVQPDPDAVVEDQWVTDTDACCRSRKVEPLARVLAGREAWITGLRRSDSAARRATPIVTYDIGRTLVKVNPLATLTDSDVEMYSQLFDLPSHPLTERGYPSIGCWPCTRPAAPGEDARSGRWSGSAKTECGLHL